MITQETLIRNALDAHALLLANILGELEPSKLEALDRVFAGGGSIGLEYVTDQDKTMNIRLIALELEGARRVLAHLSARR